MAISTVNAYEHKRFQLWNFFTNLTRIRLVEALFEEPFCSFRTSVISEIDRSNPGVCLLNARCTPWIVEYWVTWSPNLQTCSCNLRTV